MSPEQPKDTSRLTFAFNFKSAELDKVDFPVEVRQKNLHFVGRVLGSEGIDLGPGEYFITAALPSGVEISRNIVVETGGPARPPYDAGTDTEFAQVNTPRTIQLGPAPWEESPHESWDVSHFLGAWSTNVKAALGGQSLLNVRGDFGLESLGDSFDLESLGADSGTESRGAGQTEAPINRVRGFQGNVFGSLKSLTPIPNMPESLEPGRQYEFRLSENQPEQLQLIQFLQPHALPMNVVLPLSRSAPCFVSFKWLEDGQSTVDIKLFHKTADLFLRYLQNGRSEQAQFIGNILQAQELLRQKMDDPIAATVGAYALLRFRKEDLLHDWASNLASRFTWLPDGLAIEGENLARKGRHAEALACFNQILSRGLPVFGAGLSYAIDRLGRYLGYAKSFTEGKRQLPEDQVKQAQEVLPRLQRFASFAVFRSPISTYTGVDPTQPDAEEIGEPSAIFHELKHTTDATVAPTIRTDTMDKDLAQASVMPTATSVAEVITTMTSYQSTLPDDDGLKWFNLLYLEVTQAVDGAVNSTQFRDARWIADLDVVFANLYFSAINSADSGNGEVPAAWEPLFDARNRPGIAKIQYALAGMNAHINRDLPVALVDLAQKSGAFPSRTSDQFSDFQTVNALLATVETRVKALMLAGFPPTPALADVIAMWSVEKARDSAWTNGEILWHLQGVRPLADSFLAALDGTIGLAARGLLVRT